jgi:hypothetical protein
MTISEHTNDISAAIEAGELLAAPDPMTETSRFYGVTTPSGATFKVIDLDAERLKLAPHPNRAQASVSVQDARSFLDYIDRHGVPETQIYADLARRNLVGVINDHEAACIESTQTTSGDGTTRDERVQAESPQAGHRDHRVELELIQTPQWKTWTGQDKKWLDQPTFAEFLEDNAIDVVDTLGADQATLLEVAQSLQGFSGGQWKSANRLDNGSVHFAYEESVQARAGQRGDLEIPQAFVIGIAPYVGADPVEITARFRYRIRQGQMALSYALLNVDKIAEDSFRAQVDAVRDTAYCPVYYGRPE